MRSVCHTVIVPWLPPNAMEGSRKSDECATKTPQIALYFCERCQILHQTRERSKADSCAGLQIDEGNGGERQLPYRFRRIGMKLFMVALFRADAYNE